MAHGERGFTYIAAMCFVVILSIMAMQGVEVWRTTEQREREAQLLYVGEQYRAAIGMYYTLSPGSSPRYPTYLTDLLLDTRPTQTRRSLRRLFFDPITSKDWGLVTMQSNSGGGACSGSDVSSGNCSTVITGVYSTSTAKPIKQQGFVGIEAGFAGQPSYQNWKFVYTPP